MVADERYTFQIETFIFIVCVCCCMRALEMLSSRIYEISLDFKQAISLASFQHTQSRVEWLIKKWFTETEITHIWKQKATETTLRYGKKIVL